MTYPQPLGSLEVQEGQEFYRLTTALVSAGDAYELDVGFKALAIGPQSDLARVRATYYDPERAGNAQSIIVSVGNPFVGRVDAFNSKKYPVANVAGRVIITPEDLYESGWRPSSNGNDVQTFFAPVLDIIAYLREPTILPQKRADFTQRGRVTVAAGGTDTSYYIFPFYRRKYASFRVTNLVAGGATEYSMGVTGVNFTPDATSPVTTPADYRVQQTPLVVGGLIAASGTTSRSVRSSEHGMFDYLVFSISGTPLDGTAVSAGLHYTIICTDEEV